MSTRSLVVNVPPGIRKTLSDAGFKLCFAIAVGDKFNIVAKASVITSKNTITWVEKYSLFGTIQTFKSGEVIIDGASETRAITFGQTYKLKDWNSSSVSTDKSLPPTSFGFTNGVQAAPVVCMNIIGLGIATPIYIDNLLPGGSRTVFTPKPRVAVWFQRELETSTMIVFSAIQAHVVDMTDVKKFETTYNDQGQWNDADSLEFKKVNYFLCTPATIEPKEEEED